MTAHRGLGRRRSITVGTEMQVYLDRLYVMHGDNSVETIENPKLVGKVVTRD